MSTAQSCLYHGEVGHRRLRPLRHELKYRVFSLFADVDELPALGLRLRLFSHNRFNLFSIHDRDHGPGDGTAISAHAWALARAASPDEAISRIFMLCYPRVLGFVFNPLTAFYCYGPAGDLRAMIYEVNNTFGQRHSYAIPCDGSPKQSCAKAFYVSPFNRVEGRYDFVIGPPGAELSLAITLVSDGVPQLAAWFSGARAALTDRTLLRSFAGLPLLPLKVVGGIHWEAAKLWWKGMRPVARPAPPAAAVSIAPAARGAHEHRD